MIHAQSWQSSRVRKINKFFVHVHRHFFCKPSVHLMWCSITKNWHLTVCLKYFPIFHLCKCYDSIPKRRERNEMKKKLFFFYLIKNEMRIFSFTSNNIQCAFIGFIHECRKWKLREFYGTFNSLVFQCFLSRFAGKVKIAQLCTFHPHRQQEMHRKRSEKSILLRVNLLFSRSMTLSHWIKLHLFCGASSEFFISSSILNKDEVCAHLYVFNEIQKLYGFFLLFAFCQVLIFSRVVYDKLIQL